MHLLECALQTFVYWVGLVIKLLFGFRSSIKITVVSALLLLSMVGHTQEADEILGRWEQRYDAVVVEFFAGDTYIDTSSESDSQAAAETDGAEQETAAEGYSAIVKRNDWNPGRIDRLVYINVQYQGKGRWVAQEVADSGKARKVRLRLKKDGYLHTISYLDGRKKVEWMRVSE